MADSTTIVMSLSGYADVNKKLKADAKTLNEREEAVQHREMSIEKRETAVLDAEEALKSATVQFDKAVTELVRMAMSKKLSSIPGSYLRLRCYAGASFYPINLRCVLTPLPLLRRSRRRRSSASSMRRSRPVKRR